MFFNLFKKNKKAKTEPVVESPVAVEVETPTNYSFKLTVEDVTNANSSRTVFDPNSSQIEDAIRTLTLSDNNFLVLESSKPINNYTFIQATGYVANDKSAYAEAQRKECQNGKDILRNYGNMVPAITLRDILVGFTQGIAPNIANWNHMMDFDIE